MIVMWRKRQPSRLRHHHSQKYRRFQVGPKKYFIRGHVVELTVDKLTVVELIVDELPVDNWMLTFKVVNFL